MTSLESRSIIVLFLFICLLELSASNDTQFSSKPKNSPISINGVTNSSNIWAFCHFKIIKSSLKKIVALMHDRKTNAIKLSVWIKSDNETMNQTLVLKDIQWADQVGHTLYSLMVLNIYRENIISSLSNQTLKAGFHDMNIIATTEQKELCNSLEQDTLVHLIFTQLIYQLYYINDDDTEYKLCQAHIDDTTKLLKYNCCAIVGEKNQIICSDYSTVLESFSTVIFGATMFLFLLLIFPFVQNYLKQSMETTHYKISDSPMALSSILHMLLIEGRGPVKSFGRKLLFVMCVLVIGLPARNADPEIKILLSIWTFTTMCFNTNYLLQHLIDFKNLNAIEIITLPLNFKLLWRMVSKELPCFYNYLKLNLEKDSSEVTELTRLLSLEVQEHGNERQQNYESIGQFNGEHPERNVKILQGKRWLKQSLERWKYRLSICILFVFYLVMIIPLYIFLFWGTGLFMFRWRSRGKILLLKQSFFLLWSALSVFLIIVAAGGFFQVAFLTATGLFLNGQTYRPYLVPLCTVLFFCWVNWKSSVEAKYLFLNKNIYEVCKNSRPDDEQVGDESNSIVDKNDINILNDKFVIQLGNDGEPLIPKELYNKIREKFLPYNRVLFSYFFGVFIVAGFAYFLSLLLSLSQSSGVSSSTEVIGSIAATFLPFLFNIVWNNASDEQNAVDTIALKSKLKRIFVVCSSSAVSGEIVVKMKIKESLDMHDILVEFFRQKRSQEFEQSQISIIIQKFGDPHVLRQTSRFLWKISVPRTNTHFSFKLLQRKSIYDRLNSNDLDFRNLDKYLLCNGNFTNLFDFRICGILILSNRELLKNTFGFGHLPHGI